MNLTDFENDNDKLFGLELAFNCLMFQPAVGKIRPHFSFNRSSSSGITFNTIELNPRYVYSITKNISLDVGPGIGYIFSDELENNYWSIQAGFGISYTFEIITIGIETKYQWQLTKNKIHERNKLDNC